MFVVTNRIPVAKGREAEFEKRFRERAGLVDKSPGFVRNCVMKPVPSRRAREAQEAEAVPETGYYLVQTWWESEADFRNWTQSDSFRKAHASRPDPTMFAGPSVMEMHEVLFDTAAAAE